MGNCFDAEENQRDINIRPRPKRMSEEEHELIRVQLYYRSNHSFNMPKSYASAKRRGLSLDISSS